MVATGKFLTATGLVTHYPTDTSTYFTLDGQIHIYTWNVSSWAELLNLGRSTIESDPYAIRIYPSPATNSGIYAESNSGNGIGVRGTSSTSSGTGVRGDNLAGGYAGKFVMSGSTTTGAPIVLGPSASATPPSHLADKGSIWVTSDGNTFMNVAGATGIGSWRTLGIANGNLATYALADGSAYLSGGLYVRIAGVWTLMQTAAA